MKQCIALAALVCLGASGCAQSQMACGDGCAPRSSSRCCLFDGAGGGCSDDACEGCSCEGCANGGPCQRLAERIACGGCGPCGGGCGVCPTGTYPESPAFQQGPPVGQVAYPYYTTRGPRDFLLDNPPSIGPY